jgi:hypothetical protein
MGLPAALFLAKSAIPVRLGRVAWLTAFQPITVAGPRPIRTAFPASLACKLKYECMSRIRECQSAAGTSQVRVTSTVFPVWFALFDQSAQPFLGIFETVKLVEKNVHRLF